LSEYKAIKLLAEVLNHVITLGFTVNEEIDSNLLLESNNSFDLLFDEFFILGFSDFTFTKLGTSLANFFGLL
jgi:hypothetical protein